MPLTDAKLRFAKPGPKDFKLYDSTGLFILVRPGGGKLWRVRFAFNGKEKLMALGAYPRVSLVEARGAMRRCLYSIKGSTPARKSRRAKRRRSTPGR